ncbi:TIGR02678 family protein [Brevibacillus parabrevis]|uniref:TIGR02678 family protein n=1 Tax=Brevibacillus parabrevis TaxID=54914 RepID=UPI001F60D3D0|nr:TIGR02678 family protein [Brevibacillus parabrevis]MDR5000449.1 TIGR02678 family protein [Brevibacillus parabrevis]
MDKDRLVLQECIEALFHYHWIHRDTQADLYFQILARKTDIADMLREYFGYRLLLRNEFIKLEKIPVSPKPFMGIDDFTTSLHYLFFCCFLAFLEDNGEDKQFTLHNACDAIRMYYPEEAVPFAWEERSHRKAFADVLQHCVKMRLVHVVDRDIDGFRNDESHDVLLQTTPYFRHFAPLYFFDLSKIQNRSQLEEYIAKEIENGATPRQRLLRRLFLEAVIYDDELSAEEIKLLEGGEELERLNEMISGPFEYWHLERYHRTTMLTHAENRYGDYYPIDEQISNAAVQYATLILNKVNSQKVAIDHNGRVLCSEYEAIIWFQEIKDLYSHGWTKSFTERPITVIWREVMEYMSDFHMADTLPDKQIVFYSSAGRVTGEYVSQSK